MLQTKNNARPAVVRSRRILKVTIIKAAQRYLTEFVAGQVMANTSDCFHCMIDLLIVLESIFVVLVGDILFDHILCYAFGNLFIFSIIFYI